MSELKAFWLASYPKSGNTWARMLLGAYRVGAIEINGNMTGTVYDCDKYTYDAVSPFPLGDADPFRTVLLRSTVLLHLMHSTSYRPIIFKSHCANININGVDLIPQDITLSATYIVRDPRDVAVSFARHMDKTVDMTITLMNEPENMLHRPDHSAASFMQTWSNHVASWNKPGVTLIRYEDMKSDPEATFKKMIKSFGFKLNIPRLRKAIRLCDIEQLKKQESKKGFIEAGKQELFFGQGKGWQNELTEDQVKRIEQDHGEVMERIGYTLEYL